MVKNGLCRPRRPETQTTQEEKDEDLKVDMSQEQGTLCKREKGALIHHCL